MFKRTLAFLLTIGLALSIPASADVPISGLPAATPAGADLTVIVHSGTTSKATVSQWNSVFVDLTSAQTIGGAKTFSSPVASSAQYYADGASGGFAAGFHGGTGGTGLVLQSHATSGPYAYIDALNATTASAAIVLKVTRNGLASTLFTVDANGAIVATSTVTGNGAYINSSDRRLKHDIQPIRYGLREVMSLKPSAFTLNYSGKRDLGFIAQDVQSVLPELVVKIDKQGHLGMNYSGVIPVLTRAIQEQQAEIDELKGELHATAPRTSFLGRLRWLFAGG